MFSLAAFPHPEFAVRRFDHVADGAVDHDEIAGRSVIWHHAPQSKKKRFRRTASSVTSMVAAFPCGALF